MRILRGSKVKQYKVRIEFDNSKNFHSIEAHFQAENIVDAVEVVTTYFMPLGITGDNIKTLIEIEN